MFEGPEYRKSLDEDTFDQWLENGRESKMNYEFMLVIWDDMAHDYLPEYVESRQQISSQGLGIYGKTNGLTSIVAIYNLFSEAKVSLNEADG